jgi:Protein of unknown function (DUF3040)
MSLPAGQQRALSQIERTLAVDHPGLGPLFAIFTRLAGHEAMPATERVMAQRWRWRGRWRRVPTAVVVVAGLAIATGALLTLSLLLPAPPLCPGAAIGATARTQPVAAGRLPACTPRPSTPAGAGQSGLNPR